MRSSGSIGSVGTSGSVQTEILIISNARIWPDVSEHIVKMNTKTLTFTIYRAESIENLNVIHSNISPALSIHQTFNHHL